MLRCLRWKDNEHIFPPPQTLFLRGSSFFYVIWATIFLLMEQILCYRRDSPLLTEETGCKLLRYACVLLQTSSKFHSCQYLNYRNFLPVCRVFLRAHARTKFEIGFTRKKMKLFSTFTKIPLGPHSVLYCECQVDSTFNHTLIWQLSYWSTCSTF